MAFRTQSLTFWGCRKLICPDTDPMRPIYPDPPGMRSGSFKKGFWASVGAVGLLGWVFLFQHWGSWWHTLTAQPHDIANLATGWGYALLHGSTGHLMANAAALLVLGTLSYGLYPRATIRAIPLTWVVSYAVIWVLGEPGASHLGASGITYGLMVLLTTMGLTRRERPAMGASLVVWFFFGGAWWAMLPGFPGVSWEGHLGGAIGGLMAGLIWRRMDPSLETPIDLGDEEGEEEEDGESVEQWWH